MFSKKLTTVFVSGVFITGILSINTAKSYDPNNPCQKCFEENCQGESGEARKQCYDRVTKTGPCADFCHPECIVAQARLSRGSGDPGASLRCAMVSFATSPDACKNFCEKPSSVDCFFWSFGSASSAPGQSCESFKQSFQPYLKPLNNRS